MASLLIRGEAWAQNPTERADVTDKATCGMQDVVEGGMFRKARQRKRRDLCGVCEPGRSQSPHSTAAVQAARGTGNINRAEERPGRKVDA